MNTGSRQGALSRWGVVLLPSLVVLLFNFLRMAVSSPTAAGLSFLATIILVFFLFPQLKLDFVKIMLGLLLALVVGYLFAITGR